MKRFRRTRGRQGATLVELLVAVVLAGIVTLAAVILYLLNERSFDQGREKLMAQQNASWCLEAIARDVRVARRVDLVTAERMVLYDIDGAPISTWARGTVNGQSLLQRNGRSMAPEVCTALRFTLVNLESTAVDLMLELEDPAENRIRLETRSALRNHDVPGA